MPRGRTRSNLTLKQRKEQAFDLFAKGYSDGEVAKKLKVTRQTANSYRSKYEEKIHGAARSNPTLLREVLANTMRSLEELDKVRSEAWKSMESRRIRDEVTCPYCEAEFEHVFYHYVSDQSRTQYLNVLLKAQDQRAKLFGVIGVKADMLIAVAQVKVIQEKIIEFMQRELDAEHRSKLEQFLMREMPELAQVQDIEVFDVVDAEVIEDSIATV